MPAPGPQPEEFANDPEHALVRACLDPDQDRAIAAFETLYERHKDRVYSIAYRMTGSATDAMDAAQEAFCLVFRKLDSFRFNSKFATWLTRLTINCCIDHKRREQARVARHWPGLASIDEAQDVADDESSRPERFAEDGELGEHVQSSLQRLSPKLRAVLVLRYLEGLSYDDLAETLEISLGTVKSRLARAHLALERVLEGTLERFGFPENNDRSDTVA